VTAARPTGADPWPLVEVAAETGVRFLRSDRARRYRLTLRRDGTAVATIPRRGSEREARRFVEQHRAWLERARQRQQARLRVTDTWMAGTPVLWRGEARPIRVTADGPRPAVALGTEAFRVPRLDGDLRPALEAQLRRRARIELPARAWELAAATGTTITHVSIRSQRSRWGSCSARGTISLNWRLLQTPDWVRDYLIYHELMHRREMNHSRRFWARVAAVCPAWRDAEAWLRAHDGLLGR
jgi:predicted metal-dependent hydrolase